MSMVVTVAEPPITTAASILVIGKFDHPSPSMDRRCAGCATRSFTGYALAGEVGTGHSEEMTLQAASGWHDQEGLLKTRQSPNIRVTKTWLVARGMFVCDTVVTNRGGCPRPFFHSII